MRGGETEKGMIGEGRGGGEEERRRRAGEGEGRRGEDERRREKKREIPQGHRQLPSQPFEQTSHRHSTCMRQTDPPPTTAAPAGKTTRGGEVTSQPPRRSDGWSGTNPERPWRCLNTAEGTALLLVQRQVPCVGDQPCLVAGPPTHSIYRYTKLLFWWVHQSAQRGHCLVAPLSTGEDRGTSSSP